MIFVAGNEQYDFESGMVILIDKPLEWTSFDVVNKIRFLLKNQYHLKKLKVGHAGTLDPLASGLLIICTGKFTKMIENYQAQNKEYVATIKLGATTPSFDRETEEDQTFDTAHINREAIEKVVESFLGTQDQVPPIFSAKQVDGKRAYDAARKGKEVELKPVPITINEMELLEYSMPMVKIRINCSKGTYIRALARDFGQRLDSGAYLYDLRRTINGEFSVNNAMDILEFEKIIKKFATNYKIVRTTDLVNKVTI